MAEVDDLLAQYGRQPTDAAYDQYAPTPGVGLDNPFRGSVSYRQFDWAKEHPHVAAPLAKLFEYLSYLPIGRTMRGGVPLPPVRPITSPGEWPTHAAIRVGDRTFTGNSHFDAMQAAEAELGPQVWTQASKKQIASGGLDDGYITNLGNYVPRHVGGRMLDELNQTRHYRTWRGEDKKGKDNLLSEALELYNPKTGREKP